MKKILILLLCATLSGCATSQQSSNQLSWYEKLMMYEANLQGKNPSATLMNLREAKIRREQAKRQKEDEVYQDECKSWW